VRRLKSAQTAEKHTGSMTLTPECRGRTEGAMNEIEIYIDDTPVRFTNDGRVFVIDAIAAVTEVFAEGHDPSHAAPLWRDLTRRYPELLAHCREVEETDRGAVPVADSEGWEMIHEKLFDLLVATVQ
jgi:hypothetical protein